MRLGETIRRLPQPLRLRYSSAGCNILCTEEVRTSVFDLFPDLLFSPGRSNRPSLRNRYTLDLLTCNSAMTSGTVIVGDFVASVSFAWGLRPASAFRCRSSDGGRSASECSRSSVFSAGGEPGSRGCCDRACDAFSCVASTSWAVPASLASPNALRAYFRILSL